MCNQSEMENWVFLYTESTDSHALKNGTILPHPVEKPPRLHTRPWSEGKKAPSELDPIRRDAIFDFGRMRPGPHQMCLMRKITFDVAKLNLANRRKEIHDPPPSEF